MAQKTHEQQVKQWSRILKTTIEKYIDKEQKPVMEMIGNIAVTWNNIHNDLSRIFVLVSGLQDSVAQAIWNSILSDRAQRAMLQAAVGAALTDPKQRAAARRINDLINDVNKLSSERDSSVHTPFTIIIEDRQLKVIPDTLAGNKHAKNLNKEKLRNDLLERSVRLGDLETHARDLVNRLHNPDSSAPWPRKPDTLRILQNPRQVEPHHGKAVQLPERRKPSSDG